MFENKFMDVLKKHTSPEKSNEDLSKILSKIENRKRLSAKEFDRVYELLRVNGPTVKYQNIGTTIHEMHQTRNIQSQLQNI